jgi:hypothetical protein
MTSTRIRLLPALLPCFAPLAAGAAVIDVPADQPTIQAAINAAVDGDVVVVAPGTYVGAGNRNLDFGGRAITVRGSDPGDPQVVAATVLDCLQAGRGFILQSGEGLDSVIEGLTIVNGFALDGPGVYLVGGSGATVRQCVFTGHTLPLASAVVQADNFPQEPADLSVIGCTIGSSTGGAIAGLFVEDLLVAGCTIFGNAGAGVATQYGSMTSVVQDSEIECNAGTGIDLAGADLRVLRSSIFGNGGAGVALQGTFNGNEVEVANCSVVANTSESSVGGMAVHADTVATVRNCLVANNTGRSAGGLMISGFGEFFITTSTVVQNWAFEFGGGGMRAFGTDPTTISSCIFWGNLAPEGEQLLLDSGFNNPAIVAVDHCIMQGGAVAVSVDVGPDTPSQLAFGPGNLDADPLFADEGFAGHHLSAGSPAVDAGDPLFAAQPGESDLDGGLRVVAGRVDMGADEFRRAADLDADGVVGILDFLALLAAWGPCPPAGLCAADLDGDGAVGITDFLALLADWG